MKKKQQHKRGAPENRINERIRISPVLVIGADGVKLGVLPASEALGMAREQGLDLVEVVPNERPPVCRIMDYGKFKYERSKSKQAKPRETKEVRLRPNTDDADKERILARAREFLVKGHKVQLTMLFRGRQNANKAEGMRAMSDIAESLADVGQAETPPSPSPRRATMIIAPKRAVGSRESSG